MGGFVKTLVNFVPGICVFDAKETKEEKQDDEEKNIARKSGTGGFRRRGRLGVFPLKNPIRHFGRMQKLHIFFEIMKKKGKK